ncbi:MAG: hypothetical protein AMJ93_16800 [Anaerolineae bacterium SM23_84]|nr:MAG: hypothetical protein AMJ93_16800 [Anaerolineae bacterium SM23_84]
MTPTGQGALPGIFARPAVETWTGTSLAAEGGAVDQLADRFVRYCTVLWREPEADSPPPGPTYTA